MTDSNDMIANRQDILSGVKPDHHAEAMPYILQTQGPIPGVDEASRFEPMTSTLLQSMGGATVNTLMKEASAALAAGESLPDGIPSRDVNLAAGAARSARARWDLARRQGMGPDALESTAVRERARAYKRRRARCRKNILRPSERAKHHPGDAERPDGRDNNRSAGQLANSGCLSM